MRRTRLLQITHDLHVGGLPRVVDTLCRTIDRDRFEVSVLCLRDVGPLGEALRSDLGIGVHRLSENRTGPDRLAFLKIGRFLRRHPFDVIHSHNTEPFVEGMLGALMAGVPTLVHTDHARVFPDKRRYMIAEHLASHFAWRVVGVSEHTTRNLRRWERIPADKLVTIPNGIEASVYDRPVDRMAKRAELDLPPDAPVLGFASRLVEQKGLIYLLRALRPVLEVHPDLKLLVAGGGELEGALVRAAEELGVTHAVRFIGVRFDLPELLKVFDVHVLPSLWEGLPMIILESMAAGCPTVATTVGGVPSAIRDGLEGRLVEPRDPEGLAQAILDVLRDPAAREAMGERARSRFQRHFTAEVMTRRYEALYLRNPLPALG